MKIGPISKHLYNSSLWYFLRQIKVANNGFYNFIKRKNKGAERYVPILRHYHIWYSKFKATLTQSKILFKYLYFQSIDMNMGQTIDNLCLSFKNRWEKHFRYAILRYRGSREINTFLLFQHKNSPIFKFQWSWQHVSMVRFL